jgi:4-hydroxy-L-threonine phosphate dehydrogenase PdxA
VNASGVSVNTHKPVVAITAGDPAGIGPEIARKAADDPRVTEVCEPKIYGPPAGMRFECGVLSAEAGRAAYETVCDAVRDACDGRVAAIATAPVNKLAFARAGLPWKGHTDLLAHLTRAPRAAMLFWSDPLKVVLATVHVPLAEVPRLLTRDLLHDVIDLTARELPRFGIARPRLALRPAVRDARSRGIDIDGPFPGDTIFGRAARGEFDVVVACYHDQGLIPVKLLAFGRSVNVTLGLPIIRTSVDHGTAFDIAGKGIADPSSMIEAVLLAARLSKPHGQPSGA